MTLEKYFSINDEERNRYKGYIFGSTKQSNVIRVGMLEFNEDTACCWGGPFPGNFALYRLSDERQSKYLRTDAENLANFKGTGDPPKDPYDIWNIVRNHYLHEYPTFEHPWCLHIMGNDDTAYNRNFASEAEALEFIDLMEACQPLDISEIQSCFSVQ